jgi:TIGR03009 family protein
MPYLILPAVLLIAPPAEVAPAPRPAGPTVAEHLTAWKVVAAGRTNVRVEVALARTDAVLKKESKFTGSALLMKPGRAVLRLNNTCDHAKHDYEAYIWNGKTVYAYNGSPRR